MQASQSNIALERQKYVSMVNEDKRKMVHDSNLMKTNILISKSMSGISKSRLNEVQEQAVGFTRPEDRNEFILKNSMMGAPGQMSKVGGQKGKVVMHDKFDRDLKQSVTEGPKYNPHGFNRMENTLGYAYGAQGEDYIDKKEENHPRVNKSKPTHSVPDLNAQSAHNSHAPVDHPTGLGLSAHCGHNEPTLHTHPPPTHDNHSPLPHTSHATSHKPDVTLEKKTLYLEQNLIIKSKEITRLTHEGETLKATLKGQLPLKSSLEKSLRENSQLKKLSDVLKYDLSVLQETMAADHRKFDAENQEYKPIDFGHRSITDHLLTQDPKLEQAMQISKTNNENYLTQLTQYKKQIETLQYERDKAVSEYDHKSNKLEVERRVFEMQKNDVHIDNHKLYNEISGLTRELEFNREKNKNLEDTVYDFKEHIKS